MLFTRCVLLRAVPGATRSGVGGLSIRLGAQFAPIECLSVDGTRYLGDHKIAYSSYIQYRENKNEYTVARTSGYELILNLIV